MQPTSSEISFAVSHALQEDIAGGDLTAALIAAQTQARATVITREDAVLCGRAWFDEVFAQLQKTIVVDWKFQDGDRVAANALLCTVTGPAREILTGERSALNFLQTLSATATITREYADAIAGTQCRVLDTRKTIPGLRVAQKYAVHCGGGTNHRFGLHDAMLVKENHIAAAGSIAAAVTAARQVERQVMLEVEVETLDQLREAFACKVDRVLLDNFTREQMRAAVALKHSQQASCELEASGNVTLENIRQIAETGVDFISVGALTKHVKAIDLSMRFATTP
jgi:nicotinate-nucleotide pyrophosphorylase (carboxylating)